MRTAGRRRGPGLCPRAESPAPACPATAICYSALATWSKHGPPWERSPPPPMPCSPYACGCTSQCHRAAGRWQPSGTWPLIVTLSPVPARHLRGKAADRESHEWENRSSKGPAAFMSGPWTCRAAPAPPPWTPSDPRNGGKSFISYRSQKPARSCLSGEAALRDTRCRLALGGEGAVGWAGCAFGDPSLRSSRCKTCRAHGRTHPVGRYSWHGVGEDIFLSCVGPALSDVPAVELGQWSSRGEHSGTGGEERAPGRSPESSEGG